MQRLQPRRAGARYCGDNPLVGVNTVASTNASVTKGIVVAYRYTAVAGSLTSLHFYHPDANSGALNMSIGLYSNTSNTPNSLLRSCNISIPASTPAGRLSCTVSAYSLSATTYCLAIWVPTSSPINLAFRRDGSSSSNYSYKTNSTQTSLPSTFPAMTGNSAKNASFYGSN